MLRKILIIIGSLALLAILSYTLLVQKKPHSSPQIPDYIEEATAGLWHTFKPESGLFSVLFPRLPKQASFKQQAIDYEVYTAEGDDGTKFVVSMARYPTTTDLSNPQQIVNNVVQKMALGPPENEIISKEPLSIQGYAALNFNFVNRECATIGRVILAGNTLFLLTVKNRDQNNLEKNFKAFSDSFHIF